MSVNVLHKVRGRTAASKARSNDKDILRQAFRIFARKHPEWAASLFDEHFLTHRAAPILARHLASPIPPDAVALAHAWTEQIWVAPDQRRAKLDELTPIAADFLRAFSAAAERLEAAPGPRLWAASGS